MTQVLGDIVGNVQRIIRAEIRLAKAEVKEDVGLLRRAAIFGGIAVVLAGIATAFLFLAAMYALATAVGLPLAALIVAVVTLAVAGICAVVARGQLKSVGMPRTAQTVQENAQWVKTRVE
jgi:uncharacterized membrane protein YqjE